LTINRGIQIVELIKFEPMTLERLDGIPTRRIETRNSLFYLKLFLMMTVFGKISLFESEFLNNVSFCLFFLESMALRRRGNEKSIRKLSS